MELRDGGWISEVEGSGRDAGSASEVRRRRLVGDETCISHFLRLCEDKSGSYLSVSTPLKNQRAAQKLAAAPFHCYQTVKAPFGGPRLESRPWRRRKGLDGESLLGGDGEQVCFRDALVRTHLDRPLGGVSRHIQGHREFSH